MFPGATTASFRRSQQKVPRSLHSVFLEVSGLTENNGKGLREHLQQSSVGKEYLGAGLLAASDFCYIRDRFPRLPGLHGYAFEK